MLLHKGRRVYRGTEAGSLKFSSLLSSACPQISVNRWILDSLSDLSHTVNMPAAVRWQIGRAQIGLWTRKNIICAVPVPLVRGCGPPSEGDHCLHAASETSSSRGGI
jgi:hypothetical protein